MGSARRPPSPSWRPWSRSDGRRALLGAADTFRAAADAQLRTWADRVGVDVVGGQPGSDPAAVAFDAYNAAKGRGADVLVVDTAGRLHSKHNLMQELGKVVRVLQREAGSIDEVLLILDATAGQNGLAQARVFTETVGITGIVLTKMDGTARGGIASCGRAGARRPGEAGWRRGGDRRSGGVPTGRLRGRPLGRTHDRAPCRRGAARCRAGVRPVLGVQGRGGAARRGRNRVYRRQRRERRLPVILLCGSDRCRHAPCPPGRADFRAVAVACIDAADGGRRLPVRALQADPARVRRTPCVGGHRRRRGQGALVGGAAPSRVQAG